MEVFSPAIKVLVTPADCLVPAGDSCQRLWIVELDVTVKGELRLTPCQVMTRVPSLSQRFTLTELSLTRSSLDIVQCSS